MKINREVSQHMPSHPPGTCATGLTAQYTATETATQKYGSVDFAVRTLVVSLCNDTVAVVRKQRINKVGNFQIVLLQKGYCLKIKAMGFRPILNTFKLPIY